MREATGDLPERREIERLADAFCQRLPHAAPPIDIRALLRTAGVLGFVLADIRASAILVGDALEGFYMAILNRDEHPYRHNFSLAHEAGHLVLTPHYRVHARYLEQVAHRGGRDPVERACDYFAGCVLMPRALVLEAAPLVSGSAQIARIFGVSRPAMQVRLRELGLHGLARR